MSIATLGDLKAAVFDEVIRVTTITAAFPRLVAFAEHRIFYGSGIPQPSPPLRLKVMETSVQLSFTDGVASLPDDFLEARLIYWDSVPVSTPNYEPPTTFRQYRSPMTVGSPMKYTIEGNKVLLSPRISTPLDGNSINFLMPGWLFGDVDEGSSIGLTFNYYAKPAPLVDDADTNAVLVAYPALYFHAVLGETYKYMREQERRDEAFAMYAALANGLVEADIRAVTGGTPLYPRIRNARVC